MSNITIDPEIEAMMEEAKAMYPHINPYLLRVALHTALKDDEMRKKKQLKKGQYMIDLMEQEPRVYKTEYEAVEIIPPVPATEADAELPSDVPTIEELAITDAETNKDKATQTE